jgi:hypothetical protein
MPWRSELAGHHTWSIHPAIGHLLYKAELTSFSRTLRVPGSDNTLFRW